MEDVLGRKVYEELYRLLDRVTPLEGDCGLLCHKACCGQKDSGLGMYLLPGEEAMFSRQEDWLDWEEHRVEDYDFPPSWSGTTYFVRCRRDCPREKRPIQCRTFPLAPHLTPGGSLVLIWETLSLPYSCPIITGRITLRPEFAENVRRVWERLLTSPLIRDLVEFDSRQRVREGLPVELAYPHPTES
ncbi:hypothetical protein SY88_21180 [Clostridiales bacterium PH28_bin88]|nr:hypothetical protein SY88_21180 [Clostridiales bacterium PH28_bin88]